MALPFYALSAFKKLIDPNLKAGSKVCFLSYSDIVATPKAVADLFGFKVQHLKLRDDAEDILKWHKAHHITKEIVDTLHLFNNLLGYAVTVTDIVNARGCELFLDLNNPLPESDPFEGIPNFHGEFDFVFENCIDHCFNVGQAFKNSAEMVAKDGYIMHLNPLLMINHGFFSPSPTVYFDFYAANGFEIVSYRAFQGIQQVEKDYELWPNKDVYKRLKNINHDSMQLVVAKRTEVKEIVWPTQKKFQLHPMSKLV